MTGTKVSSQRPPITGTRTSEALRQALQATIEFVIELAIVEIPIIFLGS